MVEGRMFRREQIPAARESADGQGVLFAGEVDVRVGRNFLGKLAEGEKKAARHVAGFDRLAPHFFHGPLREGWFLEADACPGSRPERIDRPVLPWNSPRLALIHDERRRI